MNYKSFEKAMEKAHCRVEKSFLDDGAKQIAVFAKTSSGDDEVKIFQGKASDDKQSFDEMSKQIHTMFLQAGVKLTLLSIAEARGMNTEEEKPKSKLVGIDGKPLS